MNISSGQLNFIGTPGAYTDLNASKPLAKDVDTGTLYFAKDTFTIYQSDGSSWYSYGGGGSTPTLQEVLDTGNTTSTDIYSIADIYLGAYGNALRTYNNDITKQFYFTYQAIGSFGNNNCGLTFYQSLGNVILTTLSNSSTNFYQGLRLNFDNKTYEIGDYYNNNQGTKIYIDDTNAVIRFDTEALQFTGSLTTTTSSGNSANHLQVTINGTAYVIQLKNP